MVGVTSAQLRTWEKQGFIRPAEVFSFSDLLALKTLRKLRDMRVSGIVRREDITQDNTVNLSQIAEARVIYGGQGTMSDVQQPRYGSQLFDILMPW